MVCNECHNIADCTTCESILCEYRLDTDIRIERHLQEPSQTFRELAEQENIPIDTHDTDLHERRREIVCNDVSLFNEETYNCWKFKECDSIEQYLRQYMNTNDWEEASYQYAYDESEDWAKEKWETDDIERAFLAGAKWMYNVMSQRKNYKKD